MILFFDTETTGLPKNWKAPVTDLDNWPRLVQLAYLVYDFDGNLIHSCNEIVKPNGFTIPLDASNVHGITTDIANQRGSKIEEVFELFSIHLKRAKVIVAHNMAYDEKIIGSEMIRLGLENILDSKEKICTMESTVDLCKFDGPYGYKWPKLEELHRFLFNHDFEGAHDALADIQATAKCFWELTQKSYFTKINDLIDQSVLDDEMNLIQQEIKDKVKYYPYRRKGKYSPYIFVDSNRNPVFFKHGKPLDFEFAFAFEGELAIVRSHGWYGVINNKGEIIIEPSSTSRIAEKPVIQSNLIIANKYSSNYIDKYFGVLNTKGEIVVPFEFSKIELDSGGYIKVEGYSDNMGLSEWGLYKGMFDFDGNVIFVTIFKDLGFPSENLCAAKIEDKWGYLNMKGETIIEFKFTYAGEFRNGIAPVSNSPFFNSGSEFNDGCGFIDRTGNSVIPLEYSMSLDEVPFIRKDGYVELVIDGWHNIALFSKNGTKITPENAYSLGLPNIIESSDLLPFKVYNDWDENDNEIDRNCGYTNVDGEIIIEEKYKRCDLFSEGLALVVNLNDEILFIDISGEVIIVTAIITETPHAIHCRGFKNGFVLIEYFGAFYVLQKNGDFILENYRNNVITLTELENRFIQFEKGNLGFSFGGYNSASNELENVGIIDQFGNEIISCKYSSLSIVNFNKYLIIASKGNQYGIIDFEENVVLEFEFDYIDCRRKIALKDNIWYLISNEGFVLYNYKFFDLLKIKSPYRYQIEKKLLKEEDFLDLGNISFNENGWCFIDQNDEILVLDKNFIPFFDCN
jgi:DNA polymerase III epsilon subunit-like protein